ncbi:MAG: PTS mannitol transporter subunit IIABC [Anaerolineales bacterium]|nr:MAG: PTS mannitol transporter subunit IIABC [Anaerolineales bacterium]
MPDYLFVTGKLAADALAATLERMEPDFEYEVAVLNISVAALMDTRWIARHLTDAQGCYRVMISGWCQGDLSVIEEQVGVPVIRGPKDLKDLPVFFGRERVREGYGQYRVKILAEIVEAYRMSWEDILARAEYYRASGADIIDLGCPVQGGFPGVAEVIAGLKERGFTVSLDTFDPGTILRADEVGLDLLLSINSQNMDLAPRLHCKVVVIPDFGEGLESLERNAAQLEEWGVPYVMDPILDPLSFGFTESLHRFYETRRRHPEAEMLMGLGNLTELTDADSTGINALMAGVITELGIDYVLTTEVISWTQGAVRELDLSRKLMYYAHQNRVLPKEIDDSLITVKDPPYEHYTEAELRRMHQQLRDRNLRIFTDDNWIYVFNRDIFIRGTSPDDIFAQLNVADVSHAFYLGRELERAALAVQLGKKYIQEEELRWGYLSQGWAAT